MSFGSNCLSQIRIKEEGWALGQQPPTPSTPIPSTTTKKTTKETLINHLVYNIMMVSGLLFVEIIIPMCLAEWHRSSWISTDLCPWFNKSIIFIIFLHATILNNPASLLLTYRWPFQSSQCSQIILFSLHHWSPMFASSFFYGYSRI